MGFFTRPIAVVVMLTNVYLAAQTKPQISRDNNYTMTATYAKPVTGRWFSAALRQETDDTVSNTMTVTSSKPVTDRWPSAALKQGTDTVSNTMTATSAKPVTDKWSSAATSYAMTTRHPRPVTGRDWSKSTTDFIQASAVTLHSEHVNDLGLQKEVWTTKSGTRRGMWTEENHVNDNVSHMNTETVSLEDLSSTIDWWSLNEARLPSSQYTYLCNEMVDFIRHFDLCNATKLSPHRSSSCKNRCGERLGLVDSGRFCSCDDLCVVYGDCCWDFDEQCPQLSSHSKDFFKTYNMDQVGYSCDDTGKYKSIIGCEYHDGRPLLEILFGVNTTPVPTIPVSVKIDEEISSLNTMLPSFLTQYRYVADTLTDVVFKDAVFHMCARRGAPHELIPYTIRVDGNISKRSIEALFLGPDGYPSPYVDTSTYKLRGCFVDDILQCNECSYEIQRIFLTNACKAFKSENRAQVRDFLNLPFNFASPENQEKERLRKGSCSLLSKVKEANEDLFQQRLVVRHDEDLVTGDIVEIKPASLDWKEFTLTFNTAPWKKLRCYYFDKSLDDCDVEECSDQYYLTPQGKCSRLAYNSFRVKLNQPDSSISYPNGSEVTIPKAFPMCTCLRTFVVLKRFSFWTLQTVKTVEDSCLIHTGLFTLPSDFGNPRAVSKRRQEGKNVDLSPSTHNHSEPADTSTQNVDLSPSARDHLKPTDTSSHNVELSNSVNVHHRSAPGPEPTRMPLHGIMLESNESNGTLTHDRNSANVHEDFHEKVDENVDENVFEKIDESVNDDENVDKNVDEDVDENISENINKDVDEKVDENMNEQIDENVDENDDKNVNDNFAHKRNNADVDDNVDENVGDEETVQDNSNLNLSYEELREEFRMAMLETGYLCGDEYWWLEICISSEHVDMPPLVDICFSFTRKVNTEKEEIWKVEDELSSNYAWAPGTKAESIWGIGLVLPLVYMYFI